MTPRPVFSTLVLLVALLGLRATGAATLHRYTLSEAEAVTHGARCLDGTPYTFYTSHRHPIHILPMPRDWIVYLNGGGECDKPKDCDERVTSGFSGGAGGSSSDSPETIDDTEVSDGMLSSDRELNPHFAGFGKIYLPYLSGDDWLGAQHTSCDPWEAKHGCKDDRATKKRRLFFSGHNNLVAALNLTLYRYAVEDLFPLRSVLLSGFSAGGQGAFYHADYLVDTLRALSPRTIVKINPQYGWFAPPTDRFHDWKHGRTTDPALPYPSSANPTNVPPWLENVATVLPARCVRSLPPDDQHRPLLCGSTPRVALTIEAPLFISTNVFDSWLTGNEEKCCGRFYGPATVGPTADDDAHFAYLMAVTGPSVRGSIYNASKDPSRGAFVPACLDHQMKWSGILAPRIRNNFVATSRHNLMVQQNRSAPGHNSSGHNLSGHNSSRSARRPDFESECDHMQAVASWFFGTGGVDYDDRTVKACAPVLVDERHTAIQLDELDCNFGQIRLL